jgi:hypothetical protein
MELVVYLKNDSDLAILESLLNRLKLRFEKRNNGSFQEPKKDETEYEKNLKELQNLAAQIEESSFGDPVEWQREMRKDRPLPFRNE